MHNLCTSFIFQTPGKFKSTLSGSLKNIPSRHVKYGSTCAYFICAYNMHNVTRGRSRIFLGGRQLTTDLWCQHGGTAT